MWVGGLGGFWDGPAGDLYPRLCESLARQGIASLRIKVRHPTDLDESVADGLTGIEFFRDRGIRHIGLVGHSFAAAVVIRAAVYSTLPDTVVALAPQSQGAEIVGQLPVHCSLFLLHGTDDEVVHVSNSEYLAALAHPPRRLLLLAGPNTGWMKPPPMCTAKSAHGSVTICARRTPGRCRKPASPHDS